MNLDQQLRAALTQEAEMRTTSPPDVAGMITAGRTRRRRRNSVVVGGGLAALTLVAGGIFAATQLGDGGTTDAPVADQASEGASVPPSYERARDPLEPGTYRKYVVVEPEPGQLQADLTFALPGWDVNEHPVLERDGDWGGVGVYAVEELAGSNPCDTRPEDDWGATSRPAADTTDALAGQLASLPRSTVIEPVTRVQAFGRPGHHVRVRITDDCLPGVYHLAETSVGSHGVSYSKPGKSPDVIADFLVVDVDGSPIVAEYWHHPGADPQLVAEVAGVRDSIEFVPSG